MAYVYYCNNPGNIRVGDCSVRAVSKALNTNWESAYIGLTAEGLNLHDMPSANYVWGLYLRKNGFSQHMIDSVCPACTTVAEFADQHPEGTYVLATQNHVVTVYDGDYCDSWDSGDEVVIYYFEKET